MKGIKAFAQFIDSLTSLSLLIASIFNLLFEDKWFGLALMGMHVLYQSGNVISVYLLKKVKLDNLEQ